MQLEPEINLARALVDRLEQRHRERPGNRRLAEAADMADDIRRILEDEERASPAEVPAEPEARHALARGGLAEAERA